MIRSDLNSKIKASLGRVWLKKAEQSANRLLKLKKDYTISVVLVGRQRMRSLNKQYRKIDKPTDVLSFGGRTKERFVTPGVKEYLGEIIICPEIARRNAKNAGHSLTREMQSLYIHGLLHLLGHTHKEKKKEKKMFLLQEKILSKIK